MIKSEQLRAAIKAEVRRQIESQKGTRKGRVSEMKSAAELPGYIDRLAAALKANQHSVDFYFKNRSTVLRFARETGYGFNDFPPEAHEQGFRLFFDKLVKPYGGDKWVSLNDVKREMQSQIK